MTATDRTRPDASAVEPLGTGWAIATIAIGVFAALIGLGGMVLSFRAVSAEMTPAFGAQWAWLVPIVVDLTVFVFSGVDLVLARRAIPHPLARVTVYGATAGTVWLNYGAGGDTVGRVAHILMPSIWVMFVELMRHVVRHEAHLVGASLREPIPAARWLLSPYPTAKLWRRMVLWRVNSYTLALAHERERLRSIAQLREKHGLLWRVYITPLDRLELNLGPTKADPATGRTASAPKVAQSAAKAATPLHSATTALDGHPEPQESTPSVGHPQKSATATDGQPTMDRWVEVGHPVYVHLKATTGKRPQQGAYRDALAEEVARLNALGELPTCYADPSLTTAKRVRGAVEDRFPELSPLHLIREAS